MIDFYGDPGKLTEDQVQVRKILETAMRYYTPADFMNRVRVAIAPSISDPSQSMAMQFQAAMLAQLTAGSEAVNTILNAPLFAKWQDLGLSSDAAPALSNQQRVGLLSAIIEVAKTILAAKANELLLLSSRVVVVSEDWISQNG